MGKIVQKKVLEYFPHENVKDTMIARKSITFNHFVWMPSFVAVEISPSNMFEEL